MTAFEENLDFEQRFTRRLCVCLGPVLRNRGLLLARHGKVDGVAKTGIDADIQRRAGDFSILEAGSGLVSFRADLKVERRSSPNMFFETHSNYVLDPARHAPGWGITLEAERIWYAFEDAGLVAGLDLRELRRFLDRPVAGGSSRVPRLESFRGVMQSRHQQPNATFGRLVPWTTIPATVWRCCMFLDGQGTCELAGRNRFLRELADFLQQREPVRAAA